MHFSDRVSLCKFSSYNSGGHHASVDQCRRWSDLHQKIHLWRKVGILVCPNQSFRALLYISSSPRFILFCLGSWYTGTLSYGSTLKRMESKVWMTLTHWRLARRTTMMIQMRYIYSAQSHGISFMILN